MHWWGGERVRRKRKRGGLVRSRNDKTETEQAGRAKDFRAHLVVFVSTLFEIDISEEICGRFGSVRWIRRLYINALRTSVR